MGEIVVTLPEEARTELAEAMRRLRGDRGLVVRVSEMLAGVVGSATALGLRHLRPPAALQQRAQGLAESVLRRAFDIAVLRLRPTGRLARVERVAGRATAAASGAAGGFVGLLGLVPDVTVTTLVIMRRIAAIAVEQGEDLADPSARAACLEVFALGGDPAGMPGGEPPTGRGGGGGTDAPAGREPDLGYWSARLVLQGRPLVRLLSEAAATYGLRLSQKLTLQAVPFIGAAGGLVVNTAFLAHYETLAQAHFAIRRLERRYGATAVRQAALALAIR